MIAALLLSTLVIAAPGTDVAETARPPKISYKKRVMTDPNYRSSMTPQQIQKALRKAPRYVTRVRPAAAARTIEVVRPRYRRSWIAPAVTFGLGYGLGYHSRGRYYGWSTPLWYGSWRWGRRSYRHRYAHRRYGRSRFHFGFRYGW